MAASRFQAVETISYWELWRRSSHIPVGTQLELYSGRTGQRLLISLAEPRLIVGSAGTCDVQLQANGVAGRHVAFLWLHGQLLRVDLRNDVSRWQDAVHTVTKQDRWIWGEWTGRVRGPLTSVTPLSPVSPELQLELHEDQGGHQSATAINKEITWVGAARHCDVRLPVTNSAPLHAVLIQQPQRLFVVSLGPPGSTRVNGRDVECAVLEAGDELKLGGWATRLDVRWPDEETLIRPSAWPQQQNQSAFTKAWQAYLLGQTQQLQILNALRLQSDPTPEEVAQLDELQRLMAMQNGITDESVHSR